MLGKLINNQIMYVIQKTHHLTGGNWKTGWSGTATVGGEVVYYDVINLNDNLKQNKWYQFELVDGKANLILK